MSHPGKACDPGVCGSRHGWRVHGSVSVSAEVWGVGPLWGQTGVARRVVWDEENAPPKAPTARGLGLFDRRTARRPPLGSRPGRPGRVHSQGAGRPLRGNGEQHWGGGLFLGEALRPLPVERRRSSVGVGRAPRAWRAGCQVHEARPGPAAQRRGHRQGEGAQQHQSHRGHAGRAGRGARTRALPTGRQRESLGVLEGLGGGRAGGGGRSRLWGDYTYHSFLEMKDPSF